jgi:hypothetical protein
MSTAGHLGDLLTLDEDSDHPLYPNEHQFGESLRTFNNTKTSISVQTAYSKSINSCMWIITLLEIWSECEREKIMQIYVSNKTVMVLRDTMVAQCADIVQGAGYRKYKLCF